MISLKIITVSETFANEFKRDIYILLISFITEIKQTDLIFTETDSKITPVGISRVIIANRSIAEEIQIQITLNILDFMNAEDF